MYNVLYCIPTTLCMDVVCILHSHGVLYNTCNQRQLEQLPLVIDVLI